MITVISKPLIFLFLPHTHLSTQILLSAHGYFCLLTHPFFRILFPIKRGSLSDFQKHKVPQSILYMDCYFSINSITRQHRYNSF